MKQAFPWIALCVLVVFTAILGERIGAAHAQPPASVAEACNAAFSHLMGRNVNSSVSIGDLRSMFLLDKLRCDIPARVSGAYPQP